MRRAVLLTLSIAALCACGAPGAALAAGDPAPFGHPCSPQHGVRFCPTDTLSQRVPGFDGVPIDVDVTLPATGQGPWPTILMLHGWGGTKTSFEASSPAGHYNNVYFAQHGYAVVTPTARGFGRSCGTPASRTAACERGWTHLADQRYEIHDFQLLLGKLVDERIAKRDALASTGISYGGGQSLTLAYLKDRVRMPNGSLERWRSPDGTPLRLAAAFPRWLWSDLVSALVPNGRFLDFMPTLRRTSREPLGVMLKSYTSALYASGCGIGFCAPGDEDPQASLGRWFETINAGEPYGAAGRALARQIFNFHGGFGLPGKPAPLLLESGWTDALFPAEQSLRVYNALRAADIHAPVSMMLADLGHSPGTNKPATAAYDTAIGDRFLAARLKGRGEPPAPGRVFVHAQTCPASRPDLGPFSARNWSALHRGAVRVGSAAAQTVTSGGGDPQLAQALNPIVAHSCATYPATDAPGTAVYTKPVRSAFTMLGLPTIRARIDTDGRFGQLDSRLWDVAPDGKQILVSRGTYRLRDDQRGAVVLQLRGNAYRFAAGHTIRLELLGRDTPTFRASNGSFTIHVRDLRADLPTLEGPSRGGQIRAPSRPALRITVHPRSVRAGHRTTLRFRVTTRPVPGLPARAVQGALVRVGVHTARTGPHGGARIRARLVRRGRVRAKASASQQGMRGASTTIRVRGHRQRRIGDLRGDSHGEEAPARPRLTG